MQKFSNLLSLAVLLAATAILLVACQKDEEEPTVGLPENLVVTVGIAQGNVQLTATADRANFYSFTFVEGSEAETFENTDGESSYTYSASGTYDIVVRAHATNTEFISVTETVEIVIPTAGGGNDGIPSTGFVSPLSYDGYTLVWQDEFDGDALSSDWIHETGTGNWGWGNGEEQWYRQQNTEVSDGLLKITAKEEWYNGSNYTSSRIKTQGNRFFEKGRVDIRAAVPQGQGIWPALWMLGENFATDGWPACGEIDIMEMVGGSTYNNATVHGTIHWDNGGGHASYGGSTTVSPGILADNFHVFSIIWDDNTIRWLLDDVQYHQANINNDLMSEFHDEFFFIFNVAVGGQWPGSPDATTEFPQTMAVDYVRVFQQ